MTFRRVSLAALALLWAACGIPLGLERAHANSTTANLGLNKPAVGADSDLWGGDLNANADAIDAEFARTARGDANYTILSTDRNVALTAAFTAPRSFTLPAASTLKTGQAIRIIDEAGAISAANPMTIAAAGSDTLNGGAALSVDVARSTVSLRSDGTSKWTAEVGPNGSTPTGVLVFSTAGQFVAAGATVYLGPASAETVIGTSPISAPFAGTVSDLSAGNSGSPGTGQSFVYTLVKNLSTTLLSCTISGGGSQVCSDHTDAVTVAVGDRLELQLVTSNGAPTRKHVVSISIRP